MKLGKKSTFFLLPIFVIVWGLLGFKLYVTFFGKDNPVLLPHHEKFVDNKPSSEKRYVPLLNYSDPFLKTHRRISKPHIPEEVKVVSFEPLPKQKPQVEYLGFISSSEGGERQAVILFENKLFVLSKGNSFNNYLVLDISADSITVSGQDYVWKYGLNP